MKFDYLTEQKILRESAHKLLAKECPSDFIREMADHETGHSGDLWNKMAELGWMGLLIPEAYNGSGPDFFYAAIVLEEMGYAGYSEPFFSSAIMGTMPVIDSGSAKQKKKILPGLATGKSKATLAWLEADASYSPGAIKLSAVKKDDSYTLSGSKMFVEQAHLADLIICAARTSDDPSGISLFLIDMEAEELEINPLHTIADDRMFEVVFNDVQVPESMLLGEENQAGPVLEKLLLKSAVAKSAEMCGGARRVMDIVIPYVKGRKQFGKPVGAFQAIQHHCADMQTWLETMKFVTYQAAWKISNGLPYEMDASICKTWTSEAYRKLVALGHQVMGGIGFMEEIDLQIYFRKAKTVEMAMGNSDHHRELIAEKMGL